MLNKKGNPRSPSFLKKGATFAAMFFSINVDVISLGFEFLNLLSWRKVIHYFKQISNGFRLANQ